MVPAMGEVALLLREMLYVSLPLLACMIFVAVSVGVAVSASLFDFWEANQQERIISFNHIFFQGFIGVLGEFSALLTIDPNITSADFYSHTIILDSLIYISSILTSVFLVNLMSAPRSPPSPLIPPPSSAATLASATLTRARGMRCRSCKDDVHV
jgi:hypothetical protein